MNERIRELAREAAGGLLDYTAEGEWKLSQNEAEKFAELIVQECVQVCNDVDAEYEGEDVLATWCARAIKDHFGDAE